MDSEKNTRENVLQMLELCKEYEVCVDKSEVMHTLTWMLEILSYVKEVLEFCKFPEELGW